MDRRDVIKASMLGLATASLPSGTIATPAPTDGSLQRQHVAWRRGKETLSKWSRIRRAAVLSVK